MSGIGHVLWVMFQWPQGIVVGNLIASVIWAAPTFLHLHLKQRKIEHQVKLQRHYNKNDPYTIDALDSERPSA